MPDAWDPAAITEAVNAFADFLLRYAIALAAVGALSMALVEAWKKIFDSRTKYHMRAVQGWVEDPLAYAQIIHLTTGTPPPADGEAARLAARHGRMKHENTPLPPEQELALFTLELERMMGHIQEAADTVLRDPASYAALYRFLTTGVRDQDRDQWAAQAGKAVDKDKAAEHAGLYARVHGAARRKLDAFQLYTGFRWANSQQLAANAVGTAVLFAALLLPYFSAQSEASWVNLAAILVLSALGGVLAPIAKDMVVALKRVRSGG